MSYDQYFKQAKRNTGKGPKKQKVPSRKRASQKTRSHQAPNVSQLESRLNQLAKRPKPVYSKNHILLGLVCGLGFCLCLLLMTSSESVFKAIDGIEIGFFSPAKAQSQEKNASSKKEVVENSAPSPEKEKTVEVPDVRNWSNEELSFFASLNKRKEGLDQREQELKKLEEELQKKQVELDKKISELETMRANIAEVLKEKVTEDQKRLDKLVQVYQNMKPVNAAAILATVDESLAIEILGKMKKREAAAILNFVEAKKARRLSERFTGYSKK